MSRHFVHYMKYSYGERRRFFKGLIKDGRAIVIERFKAGFLVETTNGIDYRISRKGRVIKDEQSHQG